MDIYQWLSSEELKYFYIRNNLYLNRLNSTELDFLKNKLNNNDENLDMQTEQFIINTMEKVISEKINMSQENFYYGPVNPSFEAKPNSLIIGFRYDEFNEQGLTDDEWDLQHEKQQSDKFSKLSQLQMQLYKYNKLPVKLIEYSDYSIIKKK